MDTEMNKCMICGSENPSSARYCSSCGALIGAEEARVVVRKPRVKKERPKRSIRVIIRNSILMLIATLMLVTCFLPVAEIDFEELDDSLEGLELTLTPLEMTVLFFDNLRMLDEEELTETKLYDRVTELTEELAEDLAGKDIEEFDDLSSKQEKKVVKLIRLMMRLMMQSEESKVRLPMVAAFAVTVIFALASVALFVFALLNLLGYLLGGKGQYRITVLLASVVCMLIPLLYYVYGGALSSPVAVLDVGISSDVALSGDIGEMMSPSAWAVAILAVWGAFAVYSLVERIILNHRSFDLRKCIVSAITLTMSVLIICMAFVSPIGAVIDTTFSDGREREVKLGVDFYHYTNYVLTEDEADDINDALELDALGNMVESYGKYTSTEVRRGKADGLTAAVINYALICGVKGSVYGVFVLPYLFAVLAVAGASILAAISVYYIIVGDGKRLWTILLGSLTLLLAALYLALVIVHVSVTNNCLESFVADADVFSVRMGAGSIMLLIFAALAFTSTFFNRARRVVVFEDEAVCDGEHSSEASDCTDGSADACTESEPVLAEAVSPEAE